MQFGAHALVFTGTFDKAGITESVERAAAAGFDLIEFPLMDLATFDGDHAARELKRCSMSASASLGLTDATDLTSDDPTAVVAGEAMLNDCLDIVHTMGSPALCGVIYSAMRKYASPATTAGRANSAAALRRLADRAAGLGIRLSLEVVNRYETNLINTARQAMAFLGEVGSDNASVHLDTYHMNIEEPDMYEPVLDVGDRLGYVHIGESHRGYLGTGTVDFDNLFKALVRVGYDGPVVV